MFRGSCPDDNLVQCRAEHCGQDDQVVQRGQGHAALPPVDCLGRVETENVLQIPVAVRSMEGKTPTGIHSFRMWITKNEAACPVRQAASKTVRMSAHTAFRVFFMRRLRAQQSRVQFYKAVPVESWLVMTHGY